MLIELRLISLKYINNKMNIIKFRKLKPVLSLFSLFSSYWQNTYFSSHVDSWDLAMWPLIYVVDAT